MNAQTKRHAFRLEAGAARHLGRLGGELTVVEGRVWLTRDGDLGDHILEPGQRTRLGVDDNAVIESLRTGESITVRWNPRRRTLAGAVFEAPLRLVAALATVTAAGLDALARRAAAGATGSISCDSMASTGTAK